MMSCDEWLEDPSFRGPHELTIREAGLRLHEGLSHPHQASPEQIEANIKKAIERGELIPKRGSLSEYEWVSVPVILDANAVGDWAKRTGLDISRIGSWPSYISNENSLADAMYSKLMTLRAIDRIYDNEKRYAAIVADMRSNDVGLMKQRLVELMEENTRLVKNEPKEEKPRGRKPNHDPEVMQKLFAALGTVTSGMIRSEIEDPSRRQVIVDDVLNDFKDKAKIPEHSWADRWIKAFLSAYQ